MPEFCPKCGSMVPDGTERCPVCGARIQPRMLDKKKGFSLADWFNYSWVTIVIVLVAILVPVAIGLLCFWLYGVFGS